MKNFKLRKSVLCAGLVMTIASMGLSPVSYSAASLCTDTALAGISLILDQYSDTVESEAVEASVASIQSLEEVGVETETTEEQELVEGRTVEETTSEETSEDAEEPAEEPVKESEYANVGISIANNYVNIRRKPNTESKVLGKLYKGSAATILKRKDEWVKIKSGSVTGWINSEFLAIGFDAEELVDTYGTKWATVTCTTLYVREKKSTDSTILTMVPIDETFEIKKEGKDWVKIVVDAGDEADNATIGWVSKDYVDMSVTFEEAISIEEEEAEARRKAEAEAALEAQRKAEADRLAALQAAANNTTSSSSSNSSSSSQSSSSSSASSSSQSSKPSSSTSNSQSSKPSNSTSNSTSGQTSTSNGGSGSAIASFALKFVGNPYVYGGTSLTNGADCSGFTQSVFANFGISIPRTSSSQACSGRSVSIGSVQPGDLIFYASNGRINHVALYIGGGQVVHASNPRTGIRTSNMYYRQPQCARRYW